MFYFLYSDKNRDRGEIWELVFLNYLSEKMIVSVPKSVVVDFVRF